MVAGGKTLVQWTYEQATEVGATVIVATPDAEIARAVSKFGGQARITSDDFPTGTHRVAESCNWFRGHFTCVCWQVDEPLIHPTMVVDLFKAAKTDQSSIHTLVSPLSKSDYDNLHQTKAIHSRGMCHWFSRVPMAGSKAHVGIYAYDSVLLKKLGRLRPTTYSLAESLEQLAWLEAGYPIRGIEISQTPLSVNTASDWLRFRKQVEG